METRLRLINSISDINIEANISNIIINNSCITIHEYQKAGKKDINECYFYSYYKRNIKKNIDKYMHKISKNELLHFILPFNNGIIYAFKLNINNYIEYKDDFLVSYKGFYYKIFIRAFAIDFIAKFINFVKIIILVNENFEFYTEVYNKISEKFEIFKKAKFITTKKEKDLKHIPSKYSNRKIIIFDDNFVSWNKEVLDLSNSNCISKNVYLIPLKRYLPNGEITVVLNNFYYIKNYFNLNIIKTKQYFFENDTLDNSNNNSQLYYLYKNLNKIITNYYIKKIICYNNLNFSSIFNNIKAKTNTILSDCKFYVSKKIFEHTDILFIINLLGGTVISDQNTNNSNYKYLIFKEDFDKLDVLNNNIQYVEIKYILDCYFYIENIDINSYCLNNNINM